MSTHTYTGSDKENVSRHSQLSLLREKWGRASSRRQTCPRTPNNCTYSKLSVEENCPQLAEVMACPSPNVLLEFTAFRCLKLINSTCMKYDPCGTQNGSLMLFGTGKFRFLHREVREVWYHHTENTPTQLDFSWFQFIPLFPSTIQLDEKIQNSPPYTYTTDNFWGKKKSSHFLLLFSGLFPIVLSP